MIYEFCINLIWYEFYIKSDLILNKSDLVRILHKSDLILHKSDLV
jgi:hypothetical protein